METDELWLRGVIAEDLQDLLLESADVADFLQELSWYASDIFSGPEHPVLCSVTVVRPKKPALVAASGPEAFAMDQVQIDTGEGPCPAAIREHRTVYARDLGRDGRWAALSAPAVNRVGYGHPVAAGRPGAGGFEVLCRGPGGVWRG